MRSEFRDSSSALNGGRAWWAHFEFTRINIRPTVLRKKIEERRIVGALGIVHERRAGSGEDVFSRASRRKRV